MNELAVRDISFSETMQLGEVLAKSGFFQDSQSAAQAIVKVLAGRELGFGPVASMTGINVIKGKVSLSANLIAAAIKRSGRYNYRVVRLDDTACSIKFFEGGKEIGDSTFTMDDAKQAGLATDNWRKFPKNMLFARAMSNGAKWYCPDLSGGPLYTPDELGMEVDGETGEIITAPEWHAVPEVTYTQKAQPAPAKPAGIPTEPEAFLEYVNENVEIKFDNTFHIMNAIKNHAPKFTWDALKTGQAAAEKAFNIAVEHAASKKAESLTDPLFPIDDPRQDAAQL